jgi:hypothetical protein
MHRRIQPPCVAESRLSSCCTIAAWPWLTTETVMPGRGASGLHKGALTIGGIK